jgi:hypothetical protein
LYGTRFICFVPHLDAFSASVYLIRVELWDIAYDGMDSPRGFSIEITLLRGYEAVPGRFRKDNRGVEAEGCSGGRECVSGDLQEEIALSG